MDYAVVLFIDDSPCGYRVSESPEAVRFSPAPHTFGPTSRVLPEFTARRASDGWLIEGTEDPSVRIQVGRLLGQRKVTLPGRASAAP